MKIDPPRVLAHSWLLLIHQLPAKPAYLRVKIWRRLQDIGAIAVKNAVHALPKNEETQEDFEWLLREIQEGGGEALVCEARLIDGLSTRRCARCSIEPAMPIMPGWPRKHRSYRSRCAARRAATPQPRLAPRSLDCASVSLRLPASISSVPSGAKQPEELLSGLEAQLDKDEPVASKTKAEPNLAETLRNRTWVTREGVYADRIASAWLIRRFIDPEARFKFVSGKGYRKQESELRFDMFEAEFTHEGDKCTFEVLLERAGLKDSALRAIAEIIHDIDLKDDKFGRTEVAGIRTLIDGIRASTSDDARRVERGAEAFNDLYEFFRKKRR
jgi:hypothetical protein